jgi:NodT family efflux transporter outer membrane factor (OMF) lipoprotein
MAVGGKRFTVVLGLAAWLAGCTTVGPEYAPPPDPLAEVWITHPDNVTLQAPTTLEQWWTGFEDPVLDQVVKLARLRNNSLEIAALRVLEARAQLAIADTLGLPQTQIVAGEAVWVRPAQSDLLKLLDVDDFWQFSLGASVSWELDFWGRYRRTAEAAQAAFLASDAAYQESLALLTAQTVATYVTLREYQEQVDIARDNVKLQQRSYDIAGVLYRQGEDSELDMQQAHSLLLSTQATIPALEAAVRQARNALALLLGETPGALDAVLAERRPIPDPPTELAIGVPADLLRRRPDVRQAEWLAMAQNAQVGVATADLYPRFSLSGALGLSAGGPGDSDLGELFDGDSLNAALGANFVWPFLDHGRTRNNIRIEDARLQQALLAYRQTVLTAASEAEDALAEMQGALAQASILAEAVHAAKRSNELSTLRYQEGFSDYQRVLDSQSRLFNQQTRLVSQRAEAALSVVDLYLALGGGWSPSDRLPPLDEDTLRQMRERTDWGDLLDEVAVSESELEPMTP